MSGLYMAEGIHLRASPFMCRGGRNVPI